MSGAKILITTVTNKIKHDGKLVSYELKGIGNTLYLTKLKITKS